MAMPDLLTYVAIAARILMLAYVVAWTVTIIARITGVRANEALPRKAMLRYGLGVSLLCGLMGWLS